MGRRKEDLLDRLIRYSEITDGCWNWYGSRNPKGYGHIKVAGRPVKAYRVSYELFRDEIPPGLVIDHLCRNTSCVNPEHLEVVDHKTNVLRGVSPAAIYAKRTHCKHGHELSGENLIKHSRRGRRCKPCNRRNVNASNRRKRLQYA